MTEKVKPKIEKVKKLEKKKNPLGDLTDEEREAVTIVFHQFETGLREGTIFTKVGNNIPAIWSKVSSFYSNSTVTKYCLMDQVKKCLRLDGRYPDVRPCFIPILNNIKVPIELVIFNWAIKKDSVVEC